MRTRRSRTTTAALVAGVLLLAGCASLDDASPGVSPDPDTPVSDDTEPDAGAGAGTDEEPGSSAAPLPADLTIVLDESGDGETRTFTLTCEPTGGDHPDADAACAALAEAGLEGFTPTPADAMCTEQWGGPQTATVEGTVDGQTVRASFSRTNGCEISRWDGLAPLLGSTDGLM